MTSSDELPSCEEEYNFDDSASNYSEENIARPKLVIRVKKQKIARDIVEVETQSQKIGMEAPPIYGPLEINGHFDYEVIGITKKDTDEIEEYALGNFDGYFRKKEILTFLEESIFVRKITLDLDHIKPIIGLIYVMPDENSYFIAHLSIHKSFRRQGLAKMLLSILAEYIKTDKRYKLVKLRVNKHNNEALNLYIKNGFKKTEKAPRPGESHPGSGEDCH